MTTDTVGGVWNFAVILCEALVVEHDVTLVAFGRPPSPAQQLSVQQQGFCFSAVDTPLEWMPDNENTLNGAAALTRIARVFRPDILHSSQFCWGALPRVGALDIPRIITAHSDVLSWAAACRPEGLAPSPWLARYIDLVQQGLSGTDAIVAPTRWMLEAFSSSFSLPQTSSVIPNGTTVAPLAAVRRERVIITAGRFWDEGKNLTLLEEVCSPFPILCAGEGARESNVHPLGVLAPDDLNGIYRSSEIYLCPSVYEPFGLAPLEAAACGCALILNDIPSLREIWGDAALYFSTQSTLEALLEYLWKNPHAVKQAAARAYTRSNDFPASNTAHRYASLYQQLTAAHIPRETPAYA